MDLEFKELSDDTNIVNQLTDFDKAITKIEELLKLAEDPELYDRLSNANKIQYNLLMSYSLNGLFWMYLKAEGIDPNKHKIKGENERLKITMNRAKQLHDRNTIMPRVNQGAAQRFIRNSLWVPVTKAGETHDESNEIASTSGENWD